MEKGAAAVQRQAVRLQGFTVIEMVVVLAIIGILAGIGFVRLRAPNAQLFANDVKAMLSQARFEAVKRNGPVAVVWDNTARAFITRIGDTRSTSFSPSPCSDPTATDLSVKSTDEYANIQVSTSFIGAVWLPNGERRNCDGTYASPTTIEISDGRNTRTLSFSSMGRVNVE